MNASQFDMSENVPKPRWSNLRGDYDSIEWRRTFGGVSHRYCQWEERWLPADQFDYHIKGRFMGFHHIYCQQCKPLAQADARAKRARLKANFDQNVADGLLSYTGADPPYQCSHCFAYRVPRPGSRAHPREFYQKDDGTWYKYCTWCQKNEDRRWQLLREDEALGNNQVKACGYCKQIKLLADFRVQTASGFQIRSHCDTCRPIIIALDRNKNQRKFQKKNTEKNHALDINGCYGYTDTQGVECKCPFGFDMNNVDFDDLVDDLRTRLGLSFTTALDYHHHSELKNGNASAISNDALRNTETDLLCNLNCKFCHAIHHALEKPLTTDPDRLQIIGYKIKSIYENGCAGPGQDPTNGNDDECPFGFHKSPTLETFLDDLVEEFDEEVVCKLFHNDHDDRLAHRYGPPAESRSLAEYIHRTTGTTLRCKMCDPIKSHRAGDNVNFNKMPPPG